MTSDHSPRGIPLCPCGEQALYHAPYHNPRLGTQLPGQMPVCVCGALYDRHRVKHKFKPGCCALPESSHKLRYRSEREQSGYRYHYVGIDGEGIGRKPHRYILITAATDEGKTWTLESRDGKALSTEQILDWMLTNLHGCRLFGFSFGYDITCILKDVDNESLYKLLRPSLRYVGEKLRPVKWNGYKLDWLQGKLTISKGKLRIAVWDLFSFFQSSFVKALEDWQISPGDIAAMKLRRGLFRWREMPAIKDYCRDECIKLAQLARKLIETHKACGFTLQSYYGPGSTASVVIRKMGAMKYRKDPPKEMRDPIARAFFGGRFEHSQMGLFPDVWGYDISSAYPYQLYQLPCLKHGKWRHVTRMVRAEIEDAQAALVHYQFECAKQTSWAPFPHRSEDGSICYPHRSEGWLWASEILAGGYMLGTSKTRLVEAWVLDSTCDCQPFKDIASMYRRRCELGKDAAGKIFKLGPNSVFGKLAQSKGINPRFQCWIWAGLVTSGTRAMILRALAMNDPSKVIGIATDGIYSTERMQMPVPIDTGTFDLPKPLGGWEEKHYDKGMLFIKPGIYLALSGEDPTIRGRGIGRRALLDARMSLVETWQRGAREHVVTVPRFHGAKTCISKALKRSARYGQWSDMPIHIHFTCPNRDSDMSLLERTEMSHPYSRSLLSEEKYEAILTEAIQYEQP